MIKPCLACISEHWRPLTLLLLAAITSLSLAPLATLPAAPGSDKLHHLLAYLALAFPVALNRPRYWLLIVVGFVFWSAGIELVQPYVNRYCEWRDLLANAMGVLLGTIVGFLAERLRY